MYTYHINRTSKQGKPAMTKFTLMEYLFSAMSFPRTWKGNDGKEVYGHLLAVTREDGSGSSFNLLVVDDATGVKHNIYIRTID